MYRVSVENKDDGTTKVYDDLVSTLLVMISPYAEDVVFENEFKDDVEHENLTLGLLSLAQGYIFAGLAEYRKMVRKKTHNDILAQQSFDFIWHLVQERANEIKKEVFEE